MTSTVPACRGELLPVPTPTTPPELLLSTFWWKLFVVIAPLFNNLPLTTSQVGCKNLISFNFIKSQRGWTSRQFSKLTPQFSLKKDAQGGGWGVKWFWDDIVYEFSLFSKFDNLTNPCVLWQTWTSCSLELERYSLRLSYSFKVCSSNSLLACFSDIFISGKMLSFLYFALPEMKVLEKYVIGP